MLVERKAGDRAGRCSGPRTATSAGSHPRGGVAVGERLAKDALFDAFASVAKALASGRRAEIVDLLGQGERSVEQVAAEIDQTVANTSHHLQTLARAGLITSRREGTRIFYSLASEGVADLWAAMRGVAAEHVAGRCRKAILSGG